MLKHAYSSYMQQAYPADELKPLSCEGRFWNQRERGTLDDCLGGYALTLVDSLSTLALVGDLPAFRRGVARVMQEVRLRQ
jgi:ER degradation enhancer, mannosidase alpha-like 3